MECNSDTNHLFSIKVHFGQAALQITAITPFFLLLFLPHTHSNTPTVILL